MEQYLRLEFLKDEGPDGRKIVMVLDNYPAHSYVELAFLPSNTTSKTPPMDAGVIRNFKLHHHFMLANRQLQAVESDKEFNGAYWTVFLLQECVVTGSAYYDCQLLP